MTESEEAQRDLVLQNVLLNATLVWVRNVEPDVFLGVAPVVDLRELPYVVLDVVLDVTPGRQADRETAALAALAGVQDLAETRALCLNQEWEAED